MEGTKTLFESTTVWGGIIALLSGTASIFGYHVDAGLQSDILSQVTGLISALGGAVAIYGRIKATKKIAPVK